MWRWIAVVVAAGIAVAACASGCAWIESNILSKEAAQQRIAAEKAIIESYKSSLAKYEAEREYWRQLIEQVAPDDERRVEWLAKEDEAFRKACYYRDLIVAREPALLAHEARIEAAEGPGDVVRSMVEFAQEVAPPAQKPIVGLVGGLLLFAWGIYERRKAANIKSAAKAVITSVQPLVDDADTATKERISQIQGVAGKRLVDMAQGKAV